MFDEDDTEIQASRGAFDWPIVVDPEGALPDCALYLRARLGQLGEERICARETGLIDDMSYVADLEAELAETRLVHDASLALQLALLRADFEGPHYG